MEEENKEQTNKQKHHHSIKGGFTRIVALILALIMCFAAGASLIFMLMA